MLTHYRQRGQHSLGGLTLRRNLSILILGSCISVLIGLVVAYSVYVDDRLLLLASSGALAVIALGLTVVDVVLKRFEVHNLKYYFLASYSLFLGLGGLECILSQELAYHKTEVVIKAVFLSYFGLACFIAGNAMARRRTLRGWRLLGRDLPREFVGLYGLAISALGVIGLFSRFELYGGFLDFAMTPYHLKHSGGLGENIWRFIGRLYVPGTAFLMYFSLSRAFGRLMRLLGIVGLAVVFTCCAVQGARGWVLQFCLVSLCAAYAFSGKKVRRWLTYALPLAGAAAVVFVMQSKFRGNPEAVVELLTDDLHYGLEDVMSNFGAYGHFMMVVEKFPREYGFTWGASFYNIVANFIPREMWAEKPVGFGKFVAGEFYGAPEIVSYASTVVGEAYANGSWAGVCLILGALGYLARTAYNSVSHGTANVLSLAWYVVLVWPFFFIVRGDMLNAVFPVLGTYMCMFVILRILWFLWCVVKREA